MSDNGRRNELTRKIYEFIRGRGCATIEEIAQATGVSTRMAYSILRAMFAKRLVLPYRPNIGRERVYCIPDVGDKLYGRERRSRTSGMICITLPVDLIETIDEIAISTGSTRSSIIKDAVEKQINHYFKLYNRQEQPEDEQQDEELDLIVPDR